MLAGEFLSKGDRALVVEVQRSWAELRTAHFLEQVAEVENIFCVLYLLKPTTKSNHLEAKVSVGTYF
jgi:hypothetical protein